MNWLTMAKKGLMGLATFGMAYLATNPNVILHLVPAAWGQMTVGGLIAAGLVMASNWLKNKNN
jgi:hypothetical protein